MYKIGVTDETMDMIFRDILAEDYIRLCEDIHDLEHQYLEAWQIEDLKNNYEYRDAMKVMLRYYLYKDEADKLINDMEKLNENSVQKELILRTLQDGVATITFTKVDGTNRVMRCTLHPDYLPVIVESKTPRKQNPDVISVWDLDVGGWRSFRVDSVQRVTSDYPA